MHLICLPYAGGSSAIFRGWAAFLPPAIKIHTPHLIGREDTRGDSSLDRKMDVGEAATCGEALVQDLTEQIMPLADRPYALYGHSMGAFLAFELARAMKRLGRPQPVHLFVGAQRSPRLPYPFPLICHLDEEQFLAKVFERYGETIRPGVLADREMRKHVVTNLRADFAVIEKYRYQSSDLLNCPITAFGGQADNRVALSEIERWKEETTATFNMQVLAGGHFFVDTDRRQLLSIIAKTLAGATARGAG